ncbi:flagellar basal body L-ring protein FlgH [Catenovulum sp. 2E275]|uniref:flagellar basal body L-ring protein FlgH n=1 Tax=Catenovulum sp. 2E275 TaxID=2980497 RepID=UPI0021CF41FF|nr:flagellar basal body L-ring protein FlgH [Catenovulum sp. 2E275]MCU4676431.1 flagellar basal body L-ring protein FlgH [Catenovulum sp. 2E275]
MKPFNYMLSSVLLGSALLSGCSSTPLNDPEPDDPMYAPIEAAPPMAQIVPDGSLFSEIANNNIYSDSKARRIGDIITVMLEESTSASKKAKAEYGKENDISMQPFTAFGRNVTFKGNPIDLGLSSETEFKGDSKADQSNSLSGQISVHVTRILPNGNLVVRGEKWLTLNTGKEYIRLTGTLRPEDVSSANTVASNRIANARIEYSGTGSFADANKQGWLSQFFYSTWWPF